MPYEAYEGAEYEVPEQEFEGVLQSYLQIEREQITANTVYEPNESAYRYRPRGFKDAELPYGPYPEVISYEKQEDGTLRLFI